MTGVTTLSGAFTLGDPVHVRGVGPGIVSDVRGGPRDVEYVVTLYGLDVDTGLPTSRACRDHEMEPDDPLVPFEVGDPVRLVGRSGNVVAVAVRHGFRYATVMVPADPVEGLGEVSEPRRFDMPEWKLHLLQQV
jgi:hypothetical protein